MRLDNKIDIFTIERVSDGRGGFKKLKKYSYSVECKLKGTSLTKQSQLYGEISQRAISIITLEPINEASIIMHNDIEYKITNSTSAFNKFAYDLIETDLND